MPDWLVSGFSPLGLLVVVLQQIPGIVWTLRPPKLDPFAKNSGTWLVEILEKTFGVATLILAWPVLLGMAAFPPSSFVLIALSQGNLLAIATGVVFGIVHVGLTYNNLGPWAQDSQKT